MNEEQPTSFDLLRRELKADDHYAWTWHCNVARPFMDVGGSHRQANSAAARFMMNAFQIDVTKFDEWEAFVRGVNDDES